MSGGPNREWKHGNRGPDYHCETMRTTRHGNLWGHPRAYEDHGPSPSVVPPPMPRRFGRDPHDKVTMELPLEVPRTYEDLVTDTNAAYLKLGAAMAFELGEHELCWVYLMEIEVRR